MAAFVWSFIGVVASGATVGGFLLATPWGRTWVRDQAQRQRRRDEDEQVRRAVLGVPAVYDRNGQEVQPASPGIAHIVSTSSLLNGRGATLVEDVAAVKAWTVEHGALHGREDDQPQRRRRHLQ